LELFEEDEMKSILDSIRSHIETHHHHNCSNEKNSSEDSKLGITGAGWLPVHVIDLHADGRLNAHVDSVRFSGNIVAGLSLLSDCVMRLKPDVDPVEKNMMRDGQLKHWIDLYLPARSLYVLSGTSRYDYTHEILPSESFWLGKYPKDIPLRERRLSLIFRDAKQADKDPSNDITSKISDPDETIMDNDVRNHQNEPSA
jgi:alkylated DNA repair protein alkB family protein 7